MPNDILIKKIEKVLEEVELNIDNLISINKEFSINLWKMDEAVQKLNKTKERVNAIKESLNDEWLLQNIRNSL